MAAHEFSRVFEAFDRIRVLPTEDREHALDLDSTLDPDQRSSVRALLAHDSPTGEFRGEPVGRAVARLVSLADEAPIPARIGPYSIERILGRGGFGTVFLAREDRPARLVALKVMRPMFSRAQAQRMEFEAESLAKLAHPGIARVFACGVAEELGGAPYIAMEYIEGIPIDAHVREHSPSVPQRVDLIARLCIAVAHAHHHGILHRDLAPKNILVDASGAPRVLDFGLARALDVDRGHSTDLTVEGTLVGTVRYMSPEQLTGDASRIDTRSDVFALGLIAFEIITGRHPYIRERAGSIGEIIRQLSETPCLRPSAINRALRGDLDLVLRKAVERDPNARYQSASALADDLQRVMERRPIAARAPSIAYLAVRLADRHRPFVLGALLVGTLLIGVAINSVMAMRRESAARSAAISALDAVISRVLSPLAPRLGTLAERETLLREIGPNIEWIARAAPNDTSVMRIQARYFSALAGVNHERFDIPKAFEERTRAVDAYARLWQATSSDVATGHEFSMAIVQLGDLEAARGDSGAAYRRYEQALLLDETLAGRAPSNLGVLSNLFWSYSRFESRSLPGDQETAATWRHRAQGIASTMVSIDEADWRSLESSAESNGRLAIFETDLEAALEHSLRAVGYARRLVALDPSIRRHQANLLFKCYASIRLALDLERIAVARDLLAVAEQTAAELHQDPADSATEAAYLIPLELARRDVARDEGDLASAANHGIAYLELVEELLMRQPYDRHAVMGKGGALVVLCRSLLTIGRVEECAARVELLDQFATEIGSKWAADEEIAAHAGAWSIAAAGFRSAMSTTAPDPDASRETP